MKSMPRLVDFEYPLWVRTGRCRLTANRRRRDFGHLDTKKAQNQTQEAIRLHLDHQGRGFVVRVEERCDRVGMCQQPMKFGVAHTVQSACNSHGGSILNFLSGPSGREQAGSGLATEQEESCQRFSFLDDWLRPWIMHPI
jgi:hypothetical protein